ncbi:hypothetical protein D1007_32673 [Hordeum vulgare]|nr:hypothetical protein D1007_32673 [Hordeum vulgare]
MSLSPRRPRAVAELRDTVTSVLRFAKIRSGDMRLGLDTFDAADDDVRAYDAAALRLNMPLREMNFSEVMTLEWAQNPTPRP